MINLIFISFAFSAGLAAFFSPCSVSLLPGFIAYYLSKKGAAESTFAGIKQGLIFGLLAILGFFTVFGIAGGGVIYLGQQIKAYIPMLGSITGGLLIVLGISILVGKDLFLEIPDYFHSKKDSSAYLFGIAYAVGALGCTFPLFATVLVQGINDSSIINGFTSLLAYIAGISVLMLGTTITTVLARDMLQKRIIQVMPYIKKISAAIIIFAGIYMVYINLIVKALF